MRKAPESTEIENPLLAQRVHLQASKEQTYRVPQDVILEQKHKTQLDDVTRETNATQKKRGGAEATSSKPREKSNDRHSRSKDKLTKDRSNEDLSLSSQSKAQQTQKRQWKAP